ncbi:MAG: T9SS type A sorting domain-containing protein [Chitinophagales bacterium]
MNFATVIQAKGNFSPSQEQLIRSHTSNKDTQISTLAEMFLAEYFDETFERIPTPVISNASKKATTTLQESYELYPNPANDHIVIKLTDKLFDKEEIHLEILNTHGEIVLSTPVNHLQVIPIQDLPSGIYFTHLHQNGEINELNKFIIIR